MVSFDVEPLFPSVPVNESPEYLKVWLSTQAGETENWSNKVKEYHKLARLCMEENYFEFRNEMYRTTSGVSMGNPLSPFLAELFMSKFFAIVHKEELENINGCINKLHRNIEFTFEIEENGVLPFLDILVKRKSEKNGFKIYRKKTTTQRCIPKDSYHSTKHKMVAFNSMIHRMLTTPMDKHDFRSEVNFILDTAMENGYSTERINKLIRKKKRKIEQENMSTLFKQNRILEEQRTTWASLRYDHHCTNLINKQLRKHNIRTSESNSKYQFRSLLNSAKDKLKIHKRCGVYKINCNNCDKFCIGQTKRAVRTRLKKHLIPMNILIQSTLISKLLLFIDIDCIAQMLLEITSSNKL
ncbi:uncharacterized protein LOC129608461 [Condylostylus longicornis]|uniref:uncharacterized protein LOC129608461 n=1 Tax=Condylostylus longicornis TaxID=2530218 RepID=UPI00244E3C04|nr:uncharacterized protein LOC129608461 [Condylostylus longicornis]